jgi:hypothetical protein
MAKSVIHRNCERIRAGLPLWVGDGGINRGADPRDRGDLTAKDRLEIEQHLASCASCRRYQSSLESAMAALFTVATETPFDPNAPSLWPALKHRIARREGPVRSTWRSAVGAMVDRWSRDRSVVEGRQPLRLRWMYDTWRAALSRPRRLAWQSHLIAKSMWLYGATLLFAATAIGVLIVGREWADAELTIVANAAPLPNPPLPRSTDGDRADDVELAAESDDSSGELAEADWPRASETPGSGLDGSVAAKVAAATRPGSDAVDHRTPIATDARDTKPAY